MRCCVSKPKKSYVSPEYAARRARFAALGPAVIVNPIGHIRARFKEELAAHVRARGTLLSGDYPFPGMLGADLRQARLAANAGCGRFVKHCARVHLA